MVDSVSYLDSTEK